MLTVANEAVNQVMLYSYKPPITANYPYLMHPIAHHGALTLQKSIQIVLPM